MSKARYAFPLVVLGFALLILLTIYISLTNGVYDISPWDLIQTMLGMNDNADKVLVLTEFRLPRIIMAALVGTGLAVAGAIIQGVTRNDLADPGILGINAGASTAIALFIFFLRGNLSNLGMFEQFAMPFFGLLGGILAAVLIYLFSYKNGTLPVERLILSGIAVGSGLSAISVYLTLKMNTQDFEMVVTWTAGSIWNANFDYILVMLCGLLLILPVLFISAHMLNIFHLDENSIKSLGVLPDRLRMGFLLGSIALVSLCVAASGGIGFVGLVAPHIARRLVGMSFQRLVPAAALVGTALVMISDFLARTILQPTEIPVGMLISLIGVPYFLYLLYRTYK